MREATQLGPGRGHQFQKLSDQLHYGRSRNLLRCKPLSLQQIPDSVFAVAGSRPKHRHPGPGRRTVLSV